MQTSGSLAPISPFSEIHFVNQRGARKGTGGSAQRVVEEVKVQGAFSRWGGGQGRIRRFQRNCWRNGVASSSKDRSSVPPLQSQSQGLLQPLRQNGDRLTSATSDGTREEFPSRSGCRCPTASACFSDKRDKLQPFSGACGFGVVVGTLASFVVCRRPAAILSRASPDAQPRCDCQVESRCTMKAPVRDVNICWASTRPLPHAIF